MTWPIPWVILASPQIDNPDPGPGGEGGIKPASSQDCWAELGYIEGSPSQNINQFQILNQCLRPICIGVPWPYDDAGVTFPAGTLLLLTGIQADATVGNSLGYLRGSGGTGTISITVVKHIWPLRVRVFGMAAGTTGTVRVRHKTDYTAGSPTVTDETFTFDGANGPDQVQVLSAPISAPAARSASAVFTISDSWSGTTPPSVVVDFNALAISRGRLVPDTLPGDFTARPDADDHRGGCWGNVDRGFAGPTSRRWRAPALHPSNWRFHVEAEPVVGAASTRSKGLAFSVDNYRFGVPDTFSQQNTVSPTWIGWPTAWIGNDLLPIEYQACAFGPTVSSGAATANLACSFNTAGPQTFAALAPFPTTYGPGWRNVRFYLDQDFVTSAVGGRSITIDSITAKVYLAGVLHASQSYTGPFTKDSHWDMANVLPATRTAAIMVEVKFEINVTMGAGSPGSSGAVTNGTASARFSPRCDIPIPTTVVGPTNEVAPGGYLASALGSSPYQGPATAHKGPGVTAHTFAAIHANVNVKGSLSATFLPPTTGVWSITGGGTDVALGEFEFRINARSSCIGRAGKRFWGHRPSVGASGTTTWTLTAVTKVTTAIPGAGATYGNGQLTGGHWFFGTMAFPAAGRYRVTATSFAGAGLILAASLSDPYVADHLAGPYTIQDGGPETEITVDITVTAACTVYLRYGQWDPFHRLTSDSPGSSYHIAWAAV